MLHRISYIGDAVFLFLLLLISVCRMRIKAECKNDYPDVFITYRSVLEHHIVVLHA